MCSTWHSTNILNFPFPDLSSWEGLWMLEANEEGKNILGGGVETVIKRARISRDREKEDWLNTVRNFGDILVLEAH